MLCYTSMKRFPIALALLSVAPVAAWAQEQRYTIQDLGTLGGATFALDVSESGLVVGRSNIDALSSHAFLWLPVPDLGLPPGMHDLGTLGDGTLSQAKGIDAVGRVVGSSTLTADPGDFARHAFLWEQGSMSDLGTFGSSPRSFAEAINQVGDVAGYVSALGCLPVLWLPEARYGLPAGLNLLPTFVGHADGKALDVNDLGQVVGYVTAACDVPNGNAHPYLWLPEPALGLPAGAHDLLAGTNDGFETFAAAINDHGEIVGYRTEDFNDYQPWIWRDGTFEPLPLPAGAVSARANDLNDAGQIVGASGADLVGPFRAVLWERGQVLDLNELIPPGTDWILETANGINQPGQIAGSGLLSGERRAFLLSPASLLEIPALNLAGAVLLSLLLAGGGAALLARRRTARGARI